MKTRTRAATVLAAALIMAPALSACGGNDGADASATLENYFHAVGDKDADAACKLQTTEDGKKALESDDDKFQECVKGMGTLFDTDKDGELKQFKDVTVQEATVDGDAATVSKDQVDGLPKDTDTSDDDSKVHLVKIDDTWYLNSKKSSVGG